MSKADMIHLASKVGVGVGWFKSIWRKKIALEKRIFAYFAQREINPTTYQAQCRANIPKGFLFLIKTKIKLV